MDYSASMNDEENPSGASPWASPGHSPQHSRTTFGTIGAEPPQSPYRGFGANPTSNGEQEGGGFGAGEHEYARPDTASTISGADTRVDETSTVAPSVADSEQTDGFVAGQGQTPMPEQARGPPRLAGESEGQNRKPTQPQYKLQAKITGLERTGRKDPILRFDVHVRSIATYAGHRGVLIRL